MRTYIAKETKSFTQGQVLADIIQGNKYQCDKKQGYFIGEFGNEISLSQEEFELYFKWDIKESHLKATTKYFKNNVKVVYLRLFPEDKDIIEYLENIKASTKSPNRAGTSDYIRKLIREDMAKNNDR